MVSRLVTAGCGACKAADKVRDSRERREAGVGLVRCPVPFHNLGTMTDHFPRLPRNEELGRTWHERHILWVARREILAIMDTWQPRQVLLLFCHRSSPAGDEATRLIVSVASSFLVVLGIGIDTPGIKRRTGRDIMRSKQCRHHRMILIVIMVHPVAPDD